MRLPDIPEDSAPTGNQLTLAEARAIIRRALDKADELHQKGAFVCERATERAGWRCF